LAQNEDKALAIIAHMLSAQLIPLIVTFLHIDSCYASSIDPHRKVIHALFLLENCLGRFNKLLSVMDEACGEAVGCVYVVI